MNFQLVMESRDPFFQPRSRRLQVSVTNLLSWNFEDCRDMALEYFCNSTSFFPAVFAGKKQSKQVRKMSEIRKKLNLKWSQRFFDKLRQNPQILKPRVSVSNFKSRVQEFLMKSRSRSFNEVSVSTASLLPVQVIENSLCRLMARLPSWKWRRETITAVC